MRGAKQSTRPKVQVPTFRKPGHIESRLNKYPLRQNVKFDPPNYDMFRNSGFGEMPEMSPQSRALTNLGRATVKQPAVRNIQIPMNLDMQLDSEFFSPPQFKSITERRPAPSLTTKGSWPAGGNLRSKGDTSRKLKSDALTRSDMTKFKFELEEQALRLQGETFMSDHDRVRNELKKVGRNVQKEIYDQIGRDFRKPGPQTLGQKDFDDDEHFDAKHRNELRNIFKSKPKEDKSFHAIQRKIQEQREEWKNLKETVHLNRRTTGSFRNPSSSGPGSYGYSKNPNAKLEAESLVKDTAVIVNEKLAEISQQFRESLKLKSDPKNYIKTPKHSAVNKLLFGEPKAPLDNKSFPGLNSFKMDFDDSDEEEQESSLMNRPGAMFYPKGNGDKSLTQKTPGMAITNSNIQRPKPSSAQLSFPVKSNTMSKHHGKKESELDFAGVVKLRSLLEANSSELFANKVKQGVTAMDDHRRTVDPEYPHPPLERMIGLPKNFDPYMVTRQVMKEKRDRELNFEISAGMTPVNPGNIGPAPAPLKEKVRNSVGGQTSHSQRKGQEQKAEITPEKIQKAIGASVKTMDEAGKVANALGTLMTRVAASRVGNEDFQQQQQILKTMFGQSESQPQRMTHFSNWNDPRKFSRSEDIGIGTEMESDDDDETQTAVEIQTQTETPSYYAMKPSLPEIKFKRDMSEVDQRRLEELRTKKREWDAQTSEMWRANAGQRS